MLNEENPFDDPSIKGLPKTDGLNEEGGGYSPPTFDGDRAQPNLYDDAVPVADKNITSTNLPFDTKNPYDGGAFQIAGGDNNREEELRAKEQALQERENLIKERESALRKQGVMPYNWPWFRPILYHDIKADIPEKFQTHCWRLHYVCLGTWLTMSWNWIVIASALFGGYGGGIMDFIWASIYISLGGVLAWKTWYKSLYTSLKGGGTAFRWFLFISCYIGHTIFVCVAAAGFPSFATCGFIFMIAMFDKSGFIGFMSFIGFVLWAVLALFSVLLLRKSWNLFRSSDAESKARQEILGAVVNQSIGNV